MGRLKWNGDHPKRRSPQRGRCRVDLCLFARGTLLCGIFGFHGRSNMAKGHRTASLLMHSPQLKVHGVPPDAPEAADLIGILPTPVWISLGTSAKRWQNLRDGRLVRPFSLPRFPISRARRKKTGARPGEVRWEVVDARPPSIMRSCSAGGT